MQQFVFRVHRTGGKLRRLGELGLAFGDVDAAHIHPGDVIVPSLVGQQGTLLDFKQCLRGHFLAVFAIERFGSISACVPEVEPRGSILVRHDTTRRRRLAVFRNQRHVCAFDGLTIDAETNYDFRRAIGAQGHFPACYFFKGSSDQLVGNIGTEQWTRRIEPVVVEAVSAGFAVCGTRRENPRALGSFAGHAGPANLHVAR